MIRSSGIVSLPSGRVDLTGNEDPTDKDGDIGIEPGASIRRDTRSYYPKRYWELLPKDILGATNQRDTGSYNPKRYWELLPKEISGAITQREIGCLMGKWR
ncbi:hypothetical protein Tco_0426109 [Tanacetum coccineum]